MTVRDVGVQIGFLMVTAGVMLFTWAVFTGQFRRGGPAVEAAEDEVEPEAWPEAVAPAPRPRARPAPRKKPPPRKRRPST